MGASSVPFAVAGHQHTGPGAVRCGGHRWFHQLYSVTLRDEVATLASVFEIMVGKVYQREKKLKEQVAELQIIIDESKRQKQVQEITESEFFYDLQEKARALRAQRDEEQPTG